MTNDASLIDTVTCFELKAISFCLDRIKDGCSGDSDEKKIKFLADRVSVF